MEEYTRKQLKIIAVLFPLYIPTVMRLSRSKDFLMCLLFLLCWFPAVLYGFHLIRRHHSDSERAD